MKYSEMIEEAKSKGLTTEKVMWESIWDVEELLYSMKKEHPKEYWRFLRKQHGRLFHNHYDEKFAEHDVEELIWTDKEGRKHEGAYWTCKQIDDATKGMTFPSGVTKWDKFVAFNSFWADTCKVLTEEQILTAAYQFYFADEDWDVNLNNSATKIWDYFCCKYSND